MIEFVWMLFFALLIAGTGLFIIYLIGLGIMLYVDEVEK